MKFTDLAKGVLRFQWQFVAGDGSFQSSFARGYQKPKAAGNTKSVIVSLLIVDVVADHLAREQNKLRVILNQFSGSPEPSRTYAEF